MPQAGEAALIFGITNDAFGYMESLNVNLDAKSVIAADGGGISKRVEWFDPITNVDGTMVWRSDTGNPNTHVGDGTLVSIADADAPAIHVDNATIQKSGGLSPDYKRVAFAGRNFPNLGT